MSNDLLESGTIAVMRENTEELRRFNKRQDTHAKWLKGLVVLGFLFFIVLVFGVYYIKTHNIVGYPVSILKQIAERC